MPFHVAIWRILAFDSRPRWWRDSWVFRVWWWLGYHAGLFRISWWYRRRRGLARERENFEVLKRGLLDCWDAIGSPHTPSFDDTSDPEVYKAGYIARTLPAYLRDLHRDGRL